MPYLNPPEPLRSRSSRPHDQPRAQTQGEENQDPQPQGKHVLRVRGLVQHWEEKLGGRESHAESELSRPPGKQASPREHYINVHRDDETTRLSELPNWRGLSMKGTKASRTILSSRARLVTGRKTEDVDSGSSCRGESLGRGAEAVLDFGFRNRKVRVRFQEEDGGRTSSFSCISRRPTQPALRQDYGSVRRKVTEINQREQDLKSREEAVRFREREIRRIERGANIRAVQLQYEEKVMMLEQRYLNWKQESMARKEKRAVEQERRKLERERTKWEAERKRAEIKVKKDESERKETEKAKLLAEIKKL